MVDYKLFLNRGETFHEGRFYIVEVARVDDDDPDFNGVPVFTVHVPVGEIDKFINCLSYLRGAIEQDIFYDVNLIKKEVNQ